MDINYKVRILNERCENHNEDGFESWEPIDFSYEESPRDYCMRKVRYLTIVKELCDNCKETITQFSNIAHLRHIDLEKLASDVELIKSRLGLTD